jgi:signal transduction histidine kinase
LSPFASIFPDVDEAALRRGLRDLIQGRRERFTHAYVADTPLGPRSEHWVIALFRVGAAIHFTAAPESLAEVEDLKIALERALKEAVARRTRLERRYVVETPEGGRRRVRVAPLRLGRRAHLLAWPDDLEPAREPAPAERLLSAQEEERHRIAIELHDSTSQHLVAVSLGLARLRRFVRAGHAERRVLEDMSRTLQAAIREIRTFSYLMNPPELERDGLAATVRRFVAGFETRTGIAASLTVTGATDGASMGVQHTLFRVLQETLTNVYRHSDATRVEVVLARRGGWIRLAVRDNGPAVDDDADQLMRAPIGVGVAGMHAPVAQLGGALKVAHRARGAEVVARLPARSPEPSQDPPKPARQGPPDV